MSPDNRPLYDCRNGDHFAELSRHAETRAHRTACARRLRGIPADSNTACVLSVSYAHPVITYARGRNGLADVREPQRRALLSEGRSERR